MADERRSAPRARVSGVVVTYDSAAGDHVETEAVNMGRDGLFVHAAKPLAVGKRIALEIHVDGQLAPWSAVGRVVWTRESDEGETRPAGMGIKLIDVEDGATATIEKLVERRSTPTPHAEPASVRTLMGVGAFSPDEPALSRQGDIRPEQSVAIDLVDKKEDPGAPEIHAEASEMAWPPPDATAVDSGAPRAVSRPARGRWITVGVLLAAAASAAYAVLDGDFDRYLGPGDAIGPKTQPVLTAPPPHPPSATSSTTAPSLSATSSRTATPSTVASTATTASATASPAGPASIGPRRAPNAAPAASSWRPTVPAPTPAEKKAPAADNPY